MENLKETFSFIETMDGEIDGLISDFLSELFNKLHKNLLQNPEYAECMKDKAELSRIIFKDDFDLDAQYGDMNATMERMMEMGCFLLGVKLGKRLGLELNM